MTKVSGELISTRIGDRLHQHRLAGARRGDDQPALAVADRRHQVEHARGKLVGARLELDPAVRD